MSFSEIDRDVPLNETNLFSHSSILKPEIDKFRDNFDRMKPELNGLIKRNHRIYEANDSFPQIKKDNLENLLTNLKRVEERMNMITDISFSKNDLSKVDLSHLTQMDILKLAESKMQECTPIERLDVIREISVEDSDRSS